MTSSQVLLLDHSSAAADEDDGDGEGGDDEGNTDDGDFSKRPLIMFQVFFADQGSRGGYTDSRKVNNI